MNIKKLSIIFTAVYLFCEVIYNLGLIESISSANTEMSVYNRLEFFGKSLSAIGLSLILIKFFKRHQHFIFIGLVPGLFFLQTIAFDAIVENLPPDVKIGAYLSGVYRNASLNKTIQDERLTDQSSYNKVLVANIGFLSESRAQRKSVEDIFKISIDSSMVEAYYENYDVLNRKVGSYWAAYSIENKKWSGYPAKVQEKIDAEFIKRTGGIPRGLSKPEFMERVAAKSPSYREYQDLIIVPGNTAFAIDEIRGRDLPIGMTKQQFVDFFNGKISEAVKKTALTPENVDSLPYSRELVSSVVIPPIAITLSLMSIILNTSILLLPVSRLLSLLPGVAAVVAFAMYSHNPYDLPKVTNNAIGVEATFHAALRPLANLIQAISIDDENPNEYEIIRINKPKPIDFKDLEEKFASLSSGGMENMPDVATNIVADEERLKNDGTYYGELRGKSNVNPYTGQAY